MNKKLILISGTSGAGEDSVIRGLIKRGLDIERVITTVTRPMRVGEAQGNPYYFISIDEFKKIIKEDKFIEWARVYGDYRGGMYEEIKRIKESGKLGIWKVDTQGVVTIKKKIPEAVAIHIKPPSVEVAVERIRKRGKDSEEVIRARAKEIIEYLKPANDEKFDYVVVNKEGKLDETIDKVIEIINK